MQTTLRIDDHLFQRAKAKAGELGLSLTRFFEEAVEERLTRLEVRPNRQIVLPVSSASGPIVSDAELRRRCEAEEMASDRSKLR